MKKIKLMLSAMALTAGALLAMPTTAVARTTCVPVYYVEGNVRWVLGRLCCDEFECWFEQIMY